MSTPVRVAAPAVEPWIEPLRAPPQWLHTSPELAMKRLLCEGSGPIFQIAHVFRGGESGALHREEFHLVEWYRLSPDLERVMTDVQALVERTLDAVAKVDGVPRRLVPRRFERVKLLELMEDTLGTKLPAQGDPGAVFGALASVRARAGVALEPGRQSERSTDPELDLLAGWTELFSLWSDLFLDPWLRSRPEVGVHIVDFPAALAALSRVDSEGHARRFETHVLGLELANGYEELRDADEQRRRFARVNALRVGHGLDALPLDEAFLAALASPGLPACCGAALGLDRLLVLATGATSVDDLHLP